MEIKVVETNIEKDQAYLIRQTVFVEEQKVPPEREVDEYENECIHFIGYEKGEPVAAGRLRWVDGYGKLERLCVKKEYRGHSLGTQMISAIEDEVIRHGYTKAKLNAQTHAEQFYKRLGYETIPGEFIDAGIPHVTMVKNIS